MYNFNVFVSAQFGFDKLKELLESIDYGQNDRPKLSLSIYDESRLSLKGNLTENQIEIIDSAMKSNGLHYGGHISV